MAAARRLNKNLRVGLERVDHLLPVFGLAGEQIGAVDLPFAAFLFQQMEHLHKLAEHQDLLTFGQQRSSNSKSVSVLPEAVSLPTRRTDLAQAGEGGQHVHLAFVDALMTSWSRLRRSSAR